MHKISYDLFKQDIFKKSRRIPLDVYIEVTYRCNHNCLQCYNPVNRLKGAELDASELKHFIDLLVDAGCLWLNFTGGEPFIRQDFFEFYEYAMSKGLLCCIQSNGTLITRSLAERLSDNPPYSLDITIYGASRETYQTITGSGEGFDKCHKGIENLLSVGIKPSLKTTVLKQNKNDVRAIGDLAKSYGLNYSYDPNIHPRIDGDKTPQALRLSPQESADIMLADESHHKDWKEYLELHINEPIPQELVVCGALEDGFWIDPYGILRICGIVPEPTYNLRCGVTLDEAWDFFSDYINSQRPEPDNPCLKCSLFSFCGHCIGWSELEHKDWNCKVDYLCEIAHFQGIGLKKLGLWPKEVKKYGTSEKDLCKTTNHTD